MLEETCHSWGDLLHRDGLKPIKKKKSARWPKVIKYVQDWPWVPDN